MTAKAYLQRIVSLSMRIRSLEQRLYRNDASSVGLVPEYGKETVSHSRKTDSMESVVLSRVMFAEELDRKRVELNRIREECDALIEKVPEPDERLILKLRYIKMCKWKEITDIMCLSRRMVLYKHGYAMRSFEAVNAEYLSRI